MDESIAAPKRSRRITVRMLLLLPVVCAPFLYFLAMAFRVPKQERENRWTIRPLENFSPKQGEWAGSNDADLVKVARVWGPFSGRFFGQSCWLAPDRMIHYVWHDDVDAGQGENAAPASFLAELPQLLQKLPPSDPQVEPESRIYIAFPVRGVWEVRIYRRDPQSQAVKDLVEAMTAKSL